MRDIRFRAWDTKDKRFVFSPDMSHNFDRNHINFWAWCEDNEVELGDIALMQYTGLKDKNGKEIYEGDIVKYRYPKEEEEYGTPVIVEWSVDLGGFMLIDIKDEWFDGLFYGSPEYEVIGNIYENPELINSPEAK